MNHKRKRKRKKSVVAYRFFLSFFVFDKFSFSAPLSLSPFSFRLCSNPCAPERVIKSICQGEKTQRRFYLLIFFPPSLSLGKGASEKGKKKKKKPQQRKPQQRKNQNQNLNNTKMSTSRSGLLASRFVENRLQLALTALFVGWGVFLAAKKLKKSEDMHMRHDPLSLEPAEEKEPASIKLAKATMIVSARPGDPSADAIAAASGGAPLVRKTKKAGRGSMPMLDGGVGAFFFPL